MLSRAKKSNRFDLDIQLVSCAPNTEASCFCVDVLATASEVKLRTLGVKRVNDNMHNQLCSEKRGDENSPDVSKMETTDLSSAPISGSYYRSTSLQFKTVHRFYVPWCGVVFYVLAFFGFFSAFLLRGGLSVAIVAMVNQTAVADKDVEMSNVTVDQCPRDSELQYEDGELNWNRNQQGLVLAAFYYGHGLNQVCQEYFRISLGYSYQVLSFFNIYDGRPIVPIWPIRLKVVFLYISLQVSEFGPYGIGVQN